MSLAARPPRLACGLLCLPQLPLTAQPLPASPRLASLCIALQGRRASTRVCMVQGSLSTSIQTTGAKCPLLPPVLCCDSRLLLFRSAFYFWNVSFRFSVAAFNFWNLSFIRSLAPAASGCTSSRASTRGTERPSRSKTTACSCAVRRNETPFVSVYRDRCYF